MSRGWIAAGLVLCLLVVIGGLTVGGIMAAQAGRDLTPAAATMIATLAGGLLTAVATYLGGGQQPPPPPPTGYSDPGIVVQLPPTGDDPATTPDPGERDLPQGPVDPEPIGGTGSEVPDGGEGVAPTDPPSGDPPPSPHQSATEALGPQDTDYDDVSAQFGVNQ